MLLHAHIFVDGNSLFDEIVPGKRLRLLCVRQALRNFLDLRKEPILLQVVWLIIYELLPGAVCHVDMRVGLDLRVDSRFGIYQS